MNSVETTITENGIIGQGDEISELSTADKDTETAEKQESQTKAQNAEYARRRRESKRIEELKRTRIDAIREVMAKNPFTGEEINDEDDVEEYLLMKKISEDEKDPIKDYPKYIKELKKSSKMQHSPQKTADECREFSDSFPDVDLDKLNSDTLFSVFRNGKDGKMSLTEIYKEYNSFLSCIKQNEEFKNALRMANSRAAVGALSDSLSSSDEFFSKEEVAAMSPVEIRENYEKIRKSQAKW